MVITLDKRKKPLGTCTERRARILISKGRACIYRYFPFTIIIKDKDSRKECPYGTYKIKIDPGAKYTGIAIVRNEDDAVIHYQQIEHRGEQVVSNMKTRNQSRRNRRNRETRYRRPKWGNKQIAKGKKNQYDSSRPEGWLPPSERSIGDNILNTVRKLCRLFNITKCSFEAVRFDTQLMDNPDIEGEQYQHGELKGYEIREYLLEHYGHTCQYCKGESGDSILEWEHMKPKSRGGSDSVRNATLSCRTCNREKNNMTPEEWLNAIKSKSKKTKLDEVRINGIQKVIDGKMNGVSDRYCAWANSLRRYIENGLFKIFDTVECSTGGRTKYNRTNLGLPKDHHYDALCVGEVPQNGFKDLTNGYCLYTKAMGRGTRFRGKINKCGIITQKLQKSPKKIFGFQNGDVVVADVPKGKYQGHHVGRVMTRKSGSFDIRTTENKLVTINYKYCRILQYNDGYQYSYKKGAIPLGN